ncbi:hypothetical protein BKA56DRAFT_585724 [Ilyonectria sp. MPI-CAGE-AT-0026]|nr:hypothetical protein BKA56DRAFT_585724 [Ilyonectria sp. MPI-CAGE-AT-0026]
MEKVTWKIYSHPLFSQFVQNLADESLGRTPAGAGSSVDFASLIRYQQLGGRGCATRVRLPTGEYSVFKGVDFRTALDVTEDPPTFQTGRPRLRYTRYSGAPRRNVDEDVLGDAP